ncbi:MAG: potassium channel family protein [Chloroflexota bacterium]|nr:potassium channel family protein [Chloroflexota bacterium]
MALLWRYGRRLVGGRHVVLSLLAPLIVALVLLIRVTVLWAGWLLIFAADEASVVGTVSRQPASGFDRLYFVGYTIFTLGNGDFAPNGPLWQFLTVVASGSRLILVSLAITYLVSILGAVVTKRTFATRVHAMGETPQELVINSWDGDRFSRLEFVLSSLAADLARLGTQHLVYPVVHYYHPVDRRGSSAAAIAMLDAAVTLLSSGVARPGRPSRAVSQSVRGSVGSYLSVMEPGSVTWADSAPPSPDLAPLRLAGIPTVDDAPYLLDVEEQGERRRKLRGPLESDHWHWQAASLRS